MQNNNSYKTKAFVYTLLIYAAIIAILLYIKFRTPIPPYPEGGGGPGMGLEVNLGSDIGTDEIAGLNTPQFVEEKETEKPTEPVLKQDYDEDESIKDIEKEQKNKKEIKKKEKAIKQEPQKTEQKTPQLNEKALFKKKSNEQGDIPGSGSIYGKKGGDPNALPGNGDGIGNGTGNGTGPGKDGISFSLEGRNPLYLQIPSDKSQSEGKVVVEITVDKDGRVINAIPGVKGSTTLDEQLLQIAKTAALQSKFNTKAGSTIQKGTITYRFVLQ
ncbi:MAG TPA: energy transducer TonB [Bacteroidales bacterium]|nr:energy transducer TonB [Bacteroidales bacterium]